MRFAVFKAEMLEKVNRDRKRMHGRLFRKMGRKCIRNYKTEVYIKNC